MTPLDAVVGLFALAMAIAMLGLLGLAVHLAVREKTTPNVRATDALLRFEPRGGRQRFNVRLFEVGALACTWVIGAGVLVLFLDAGELGARARLFFSVFVIALIVGTWWAQRRGIFRSPAQRLDHDVLPRLKRRHRG